MPISQHNFPFPQMSFGVNRFLLTQDEITRLDNDYNVMHTLNVSPGNSWHVADFGYFTVFANGAGVWQYSNATGFGPNVELPKFTTCCNFNGQLVVGGFIEPWHDATRNYIGWSKPGDATFVLDQSNLSGNAFVGVGEVLCVRKLGNAVVAYGDQGVWLFPSVYEPVVGFGKIQLGSIPGIASRSAVAGNDDMQVMVDSTGQLWRLTSNKAPELLGYRSYFRKMLGHEIIATYNVADNAFYFTDGEWSFRWDEFGLSRSWQALTSQWIDYGYSVGYYHDIDNAGFEIVTDILDFGFRGRKTITSIEVGGSFDQPVFASIDWRSHNERKFRSLPWRRLNQDGIVRFPVTAEEFKIKLSSNSQKAELDYVLVKYQITDRRNLRGVTNVDTTDTGADS